MANDRNGKRTVAILSSGGLLDTMAAIRSGFSPIWGTEIDSRKQNMWETLTGNQSLGDTFQLTYSELCRPNYLKSGQTCTDYSSSGSQMGAEGETGWMFISQCDLILDIKPDALCLEMVANAIQVNKGFEVNTVVEMLSEHYVLYSEPGALHKIAQAAKGMGYSDLPNAWSVECGVWVR